MARHSSVSKVERKALENQARISKQLKLMKGDQKGLHFKGYDRLLAEATAKFDKLGQLNKDIDNGGERAILARQTKAKMNYVTYFTDAAPTCKGAWDSESNKGNEAKRSVIGRDGKHQRIMKGQSARNSQAQGI